MLSGVRQCALAAAAVAVAAAVRGDCGGRSQTSVPSGSGSIAGLSGSAGTRGLARGCGGCGVCGMCGGSTSYVNHFLGSNKLTPHPYYSYDQQGWALRVITHGLQEWPLYQSQERPRVEAQHRRPRCGVVWVGTETVRLEACKSKLGNRKLKIITLTLETHNGHREFLQFEAW